MSGHPNAFRSALVAVAAMLASVAGSTAAAGRFAPSGPDQGPGAAVRAPVDGMPLVLVPGGPFRMGSAAGDPAAEPQERPERVVDVPGFWIDRTEVTNRLFARFVAATGYETVAEQLGYSFGFVDAGWQAIRGATWRRPRGPGSTIDRMDDHPVVAMGWRDAAAYCRWAGRRLPTEAEWEKAARGTDARRYPWGDTDPDGTRVNLADRSSGLPWAETGFNDGFAATSPAGHFGPGASPYGALDLAGNAWEWVGDWYDPAWYGSARPGDPSGPTTGASRTLRGGSFNDDAAHVRAARRSGDDLDYSAVDGGFRCARDATWTYMFFPLALKGPAWRVPTPTPVRPTATRTPAPPPTLPRPPTAPPGPTDLPPPTPDVCAPVTDRPFAALTIEGGPTDRPAAAHPDLNLSLRGYVPASAPAVLVDYGGGTDTRAPKLVGLLNRLPAFVSTGAIYHWDWGNDRRGGLIGEWPATLLGLATAPGEPVHVPNSGYGIGDGQMVLVLYATDTRATLKYTRDDNVVTGYTVHVEGVCVDPGLRNLYAELDREGRRRLPALPAGRAFGRARGPAVAVAVRDTGTFMDPRSRKDWWPGLAHPFAGSIADPREHATR